MPRIPPTALHKEHVFVRGYAGKPLHISNMRSGGLRHGNGPIVVIPVWLHFIIIPRTGARVIVVARAEPLVSLVRLLYFVFSRASLLTHHVHLPGELSDSSESVVRSLDRTHHMLLFFYSLVLYLFLYAEVFLPTRWQENLPTR
jgi:hypothetical protein